MIKDLLSIIGIIDYCTKHKMNRVPHGWYNEKSHCPKCYEEQAPFRHAIKSVKKAKFSPFKFDLAKEVEIEKQRQKVKVVGWLVIFPIIFIMAIVGWTIYLIYSVIKFFNPISIERTEKEAYE